MKTNPYIPQSNFDKLKTKKLNDAQKTFLNMINGKKLKVDKTPRCGVCKFSLVDSTQGRCNCGKYSW